ncbi:putative Methyltransferase-16 [Candidatus Terasakiella magnetica]|uniref:Calmodulin-lysine N-methyltransferase n=1 Tax=Candidatus Terasakiella magnetica TaxID=1867952 RepID=A0A1C3RKJ0_9PROT|nr:methyltransferase domain-containing protein [Candidatus Terasakiella magnetica]SCA57765.1 putative Methyltransferase-16 [Candidatus Terasakiella magnetica]
MTLVRVRYQTIEFGKTDIHIRTLRNRQEFHDPGGKAEKLGVPSSTWSLFGVVWASGEFLAHMMSDYDIQGLRILEVGCGIGIASLVLNERTAEITATDYHPEAGSYLAKNVELNNGRDIPFVQTDWLELKDELGKFDLIIGSDLLYEPDHAELLSGFINRHAEERCKIIIVDPARGHSTNFSKKMADLGFSHELNSTQAISHLTQPLRNANKIDILSYMR